LLDSLLQEMSLKMSYVGIIVFVGSIYSQLDYNKDCQDAIRAEGLPRIWKNDENFSFPLTLLNKKDHLVAYKAPAGFDDNGQVIWGSGIYKTETLPILSCLNQDSSQLSNIIRKDYLDYPEEKKNIQLICTSRTIFNESKLSRN